MRELISTSVKFAICCNSVGISLFPYNKNNKNNSGKCCRRKVFENLILLLCGVMNIMVDSNFIACIHHYYLKFLLFLLDCFLAIFTSDHWDKFMSILMEHNNMMKTMEYRLFYWLKCCKFIISLELFGFCRGYKCLVFILNLFK